jgi:azurin
MKFNTREIIVQSGKIVKLTLKHIGQLDVQVMGHNFVLLKKKVDLIEFANKAATARDNQYIPLGSDEVIVYTDMIGGGQETAIEFLPPEPGVYDFICSFPGHYAMMKGKFIVE